MGNVVSTLAFPAPRLPRSFYERELLPRDDLVWLLTSQGERIPALDIEMKPLSSPYVLLYSHGNAEDLGLHVPFVEALARATGARVISYEYVGYSLCRDHSPSEEGCYRSIRAAWRYVVEAGVDPSRVIIYGRSIGTGPSVDLATEVDAAGLFLQSPLESAIRSALGHVSSQAMYPIDIFRNYEKIQQVGCPVAIIHGTDDKVVPFEGGEALLGASRRPFDPEWLESYGHNDIPYSKIFKYLVKFFAHLDEQQEKTQHNQRGADDSQVAAEPRR